MRLVVTIFTLACGQRDGWFRKSKFTKIAKRNCLIHVDILIDCKLFFVQTTFILNL